MARRRHTHNLCVFCATNEENELALGKLITKQGITVHNFCMLFSSGLPQRGKTDSAGILGFLTTDIVKEANRGRKLTCVYCRKKGATIGCTVRHCRRQFHLPCGVNSNSLHQFFDQFCSFCEEHRPQQGMEVVSDRLSFHGTANSTCSICLCPVEARTSNHTLRAPCCKNSWFHRTCVQRQALSAGYFFKCPLCNNKNTFQSEMLKYGIYIPEQDASWELEENAFGELLHRHNTCDAKVCKCPQGRKCNKEGSRWAICLCNLCGSQGCHIGCAKLNFQNPEWECDNCNEILNGPSIETVAEPEPVPAPEPIQRGRKRRKATTPIKRSCLVRETRGNSKLFKKQSVCAPPSPHPPSIDETDLEQELSQQELLRDTPSSSSAANSFSSARKCLLPSVSDDTDTEVDIETVDDSISPLNLLGFSSIMANVDDSDSDSVIQVCSDSDDEGGPFFEGCSDRPEDDDGDSMSLFLTPSTLASSTPRNVQNSSLCSPSANDDDNSDCIIVDDDDVEFCPSSRFVHKLDTECDNAVNKISIEASSGTAANKLSCGQPADGVVFGNLIVSSFFKPEFNLSADRNVEQPVTPTHLFRNVANTEIVPITNKAQTTQKEGIATGGSKASPLKGTVLTANVPENQDDGLNNREDDIALPAILKDESLSGDKDLALKQKLHHPVFSPFFRHLQKDECHQLSSVDTDPTSSSVSSCVAKACFKDSVSGESNEPPFTSSVPKPNSLRPTKGKCKIEFFVQGGRLLSNIVPIVVKKKGKMTSCENEQNCNSKPSESASHSSLSDGVSNCFPEADVIVDNASDVNELQTPQKARKSMRDKTASQAWNNMAVVQTMLS